MQTESQIGLHYRVFDDTPTMVSMSASRACWVQQGRCPAPVMVTGDSTRLHQVVANLLGNARTHTPEGTTVTVGVDADSDCATLRVTDDGPGIPANLIPQVFERFARGDSSRSRKAGSTGLGLAIVHAVVVAHHGTIEVQSSPGHTEFTVRLPLDGVPAA